MFPKLVFCLLVLTALFVATWMVRTGKTTDLLVVISGLLVLIGVGLIGENDRPWPRSPL